MKKSQQQNQTNNSIRKQVKSETPSGQIKPRFCAVSARHSVSTRHFRANSYVPLLLALRPRAGGPIGSNESVGSSKFGRSNKLMVPTVSLVLSLIFISSLFGLVVFPTSASAANLTLTIPSSALVVKATPNQFSKSEAQSISVSTDSVGGYTLKLSSKNNDENSNYLVNGTGSKIAPISEPLTDTEFSSSEDWNVWGFKPSKLDGANNSSSESGKFIAAPDSTPITLDTTSVANSGTANEYDITLGVKVDSTLPAGSYSNTFVLTATVNALKYDITYDAGNASTNVTNMPDPRQVTGETSSTSVTLTNTIPEWSGYVFQGWCTVQPVMKSGRDDCENTTDASSGSKGVMYKSGAEFPLTAASTVTTLYAIWDTEPLLTDVIQATSTKMTFKVGTGIEMIMVADNQVRTFDPPAVTTSTTTKWWPYYAIDGTPVTMEVELPNTLADVKYLITVVPKKGNKFIRWEKSADNTEWTAIGATPSSGTLYKPMSELTQAECKAAGEKGMNVTDIRNKVSYTVGMVGDFCWMYSNLRLEGGTRLDSTDSDLGEGMTFEVPTSAAMSTGGRQNSKKEMIECKGGVGDDVSPFEVNSNYDKNRFCADNLNTVTEFYYNR